MFNKRTKIITTIGPASEDIQIMRNLFDAGMTTIRLNFSHGNFEEHKSRIDNAKKIMKETQFPISIMLDTKGPEIRIGKVKNNLLDIKKNIEIEILTDEKSYQIETNDNQFAVSYDMSKDLQIGSLVLVDDGKLQLEVIDVKPGIVTTRSLNNHLLKTNKRINLPGTKFSIPFLSKKDIEDIKFGIKNGIDFIAASFVNTPEDIQKIKKILKEKNAEHIKIFAKIESQYAVDNFDKILKETDGVMIARGDLGLEIPYYNVPIVQKMIIRKTREVGKPVIVATQMLDSMEKNPFPTRAEVTDVYFAVELGADATMLSGESAAGEYPEKAVSIMSTINKRAEKEFYKKIYYDNYLQTLPSKNDERSKKARKITLKTKNGDYKYVVVRSKTGSLLSHIAKYRPNTNIIGVVENEKLVTAFGVTSSVFISMDLSLYKKIKLNHKNAIEIIKKFGAKKSDKYLVVDKSGISEHVYN